MKFSAVLAAIAGAAVVSAQGYNSTSAAHNSTKAYDSRTVNVPPPSAAPTTALTSIYTVASNCGSLTVFRPATSVYPLSASRTGTFTGSSTGGAAPTLGAAIAGMGGIVAAAALIL